MAEEDVIGGAVGGLTAFSFASCSSCRFLRRVTKQKQAVIVAIRMRPTPTATPAIMYILVLEFDLEEFCDVAELEDDDDCVADGAPLLGKGRDEEEVVPSVPVELRGYPRLTQRL